MMMIDLNREFGIRWRETGLDMERFKKKGYVRIHALLWANTLVSNALFAMQTYLTDVWKLSFTHASGIMNIWGGISKVLPLLFLFIIDTLLGDFKMLVVSSISYSAGMTLLAMSMPPVLGTCKKYEVKEELTPKTRLLRLTGLLLIGSLVPIAGFFVFPYIKQWLLLFGVPGIFLVCAALLFLSGWNKYNKSGPGPEGSPLSDVCRVLVAAALKISQPVQLPLDTYPHYKGDDEGLKSLELSGFLRYLLVCIHIIIG
ncbi:hypothetical protein ACS0TY_015522 [Phlomoides rotata]